MEGQEILGSQLKGNEIDLMVQDGILQRKLQGRSRIKVICNDPSRLEFYLKNQFGINNLSSYLENLELGGSRRENIKTSSDSKAKKVRTFKGFLVNCYDSIPAILNDNQLIIQPFLGSFTFICDFENFKIDKNIVIVGVENAENFRFIEHQKYLFKGQKVLFVSRYPQSKDLIKWLQSIPNQYIHFGDFDFEGIGIYLNEYQQYLGERATFFIPQNIEGLIKKYGSKDLYNLQLDRRKLIFEDDNIDNLLAIFHQYKKCLEQEILIGNEF
ncbi:DUF7281 domain-containing protein [Flammeovirga pacifica]|nr:hypothetical protein [Flammeovirga pacifica]